VVLESGVFTVAEADIPALLTAWAADASWMKKQPGYISTQWHRGIAGSTVFLNYAIAPPSSRGGAQRQDGTFWAG